MLLAVLIGIGIVLMSFPLVALFNFACNGDFGPLIVCTLGTIIYWLVTGAIGEFIYGVKWG